MHDELGDHGVVVRADLVARANAAVPAHRAGSEALRQGYAHDMKATRSWQEIVVWRFGTNTRFDGVALHPHLRLRQWQGLARGDAQLPLHQVQAGDRFGDRVFHLQAGVHLHEEEIHAALGLLDDELHSTRAHITDRLSSCHRCSTHAFAQFC